MYTFHCTVHVNPKVANPEAVMSGITFAKFNSIIQNLNRLLSLIDQNKQPQKLLIDEWVLQDSPQIKTHNKGYHAVKS